MVPPRDDMQAATAHWREAYGLAWALVGDRAVAEELTQEAYVRLGRREASTDGDRPIRSLFLAIVRNLALDELRRRRVDVLEEAELLLDPADADPARIAASRESQRLVQEALDALSPAWREILYLRDGLSLSYRQIGELVEKSEDVVRVTLHRARLRVREWIGLRMPEGEMP